LIDFEYEILLILVVSKSNDALDGYSVYAAALEKKLKMHSKKNDPKRKKMKNDF